METRQWYSWASDHNVVGLRSYSVISFTSSLSTQVYKSTHGQILLWLYWVTLQWNSIPYYRNQNKLRSYGPQLLYPPDPSWPTIPTALYSSWAIQELVISVQTSKKIFNWVALTALSGINPCQRSPQETTRITQKKGPTQWSIKQKHKLNVILPFKESKTWTWKTQTSRSVCRSQWCIDITENSGCSWITASVWNVFRPDVETQTASRNCSVEHSYISLGNMADSSFTMVFGTRNSAIANSFSRD